MLLARYFLYVGGALLALLLIVSAELPQTSVAPSTNTAADLPAIRINSDRKWPAKVVFDTSAPAVAAQVASNVADVKAPAAAMQVASSNDGSSRGICAAGTYRSEKIRRQESRAKAAPEA